MKAFKKNPSDPGKLFSVNDPKGVAWFIINNLFVPVMTMATGKICFFRIDPAIERPVTAKNEIPEIDYVWCLARTVELLWLSEKEVP